ncbi:nicotinate-nucleotide--dimethylbenzimidazole phosphoribosyltransferase [Haloplanus sp. GCM10025708]|uniref:nicotinate-nucleotide--dimethylbenzimidazole phosphoribosyltransferase n=1 Tax=Haloferacaceae TaxID=1644056 RepID=UPI0036094D6E
MRFVLAIGSTATARIDGISAAGATPDLMVHTPSADAEILTYGRPTHAPVAPVSPSGCPTPAVVTRAARELLGFDVAVVDAGTASTTTAPTVGLPGEAGADVRAAAAVPAAAAKFDAARAYGSSLPDSELVLAETIPGGTTTAMGVLTALGERARVSSSFSDNPTRLKRAVVSEALDASDLSPGGAAGDPLGAVRDVGDPVLAALAGLTVGALETGTDVTLGGGTQMSAVAALVRHFGLTETVTQATTSFVAADDTAAVRALADALDVDLLVTDPEFAGSDHPAMDAYVRGEAKEGVGMGGALALTAGTLTDTPTPPMRALRNRVVTVYDRLLSTAPDDHPATDAVGSASE